MHAWALHIYPTIMTNTNRVTWSSHKKKKTIFCATTSIHTPIILYPKVNKLLPGTLHMNILKIREVWEEKFPVGMELYSDHCIIFLCGAKMDVQIIRRVRNNSLFATIIFYGASIFLYVCNMTINHHLPLSTSDHNKKETWLHHNLYMLATPAIPYHNKWMQQSIDRIT